MARAAPAPPRRLRAGRVLAGFGLLTLAALFFADLDLSRPDPWMTLQRIGAGLLSPDLSDPGGLAYAAALTVAFAVCGVFAGAAAGFLLSFGYGLRPVRAFCILIRSVHELFWALLLLGLTGLGPLTGVLAIALPYTGIFAKVFAEYLTEADPAAARALPAGTPRLSRLLWARLPQALPELGAYTLYRLECGLRSSAVLGFVGLPTLGYLLETDFRQAQYGAAASALGVYLLLILPIRHWMRLKLAPLWLAASAWLLARHPSPPMGDGALMRFLSDLTPAPLRHGDWASAQGWSDLWPWLDKVLIEQALPGLVATLVLSQVALALAALVAATGFPLIVRRVTGRLGALLGHLALVLARSIPDYMLAFLILQITGPSMLPAILALGLHNGAIIAHLLGRQGEALVPRLRPDAPRGLRLAAWELLPRLSGNFFALCLYRWEIIVRDSAILGLLGIATLGFYVDAAVQELRIDRALLLLLVSALLTLGIDALSGWIRARMRLSAPGMRRAEPEAAEAA
ncbi:PhnE/PtxC family ABC transporter permease [Limimaricola pyoseonensis]|uniref:Phosphonate transport system permease protein n=1 Tax=Limimaricola pyoseonensis TaxID=521013 RepID=A0A1G7K8G3_9RHOB|nr:ABC transporter permease [Limimaricola pyoseonensis]SDF33533.1 phosphonate transport system permease protein [Limimaricola pyoseonensis]